MITFIFAALISAQPAAARPLQWTYDCKWTVSAPQPAADVQVVKTARKNRDGKWESKFTVVRRLRNSNAAPISYALVNSGDGDEDYMNYELAVRDDKAPIQGAVIQNQLKWIKVLDEDGSSSYDCR